MEGGIDKDIGVYGGLFLTIISDLRGSSPVWEDFTSKATKLHTSLKSTLTAIAAFLDAFQKVADMATGSRGATKELGTALTRLCMRHKAIESKLKKFTGTILDNLVNPLQECMEDWKKTVVQLDKEHAKEYKRAKQDIKKCAADTVRLQKKVKKGKQDMQSRLDSAMQEVNDKYILLEDQEKNSVRTALTEERGRFCHFVTCLKPFVDEEVNLLTEVTHLQEIMDNLCLQADSPHVLPASSEQVILDLKGEDAGSYKFQTPPSSPSSLGSRKSSMCSINSIASSSSGSAQSHSPCHNKTIQQQQAQLLGSGVRLTSVSSQDSGFTSQDTLFLRPTTPSSLSLQTQTADSNSQDADTPEVDSTPSTPSENYPNTPSATSTWTNWPNPPIAGGKSEPGRPHTISSAYEKTHSRPALSSQLFEPPQQGATEVSKPEDQHDATVIKRERPHSTMSVPYSRQSASITKMQPVLPPLGPKPKSRAVAPPKVPPSIGEQPVYANLNELNIQVQGQGGDSDTDKTPTTRDPPFEPNAANPKLDGMDLTEAIRDLDNYTAALHGDFTPGDRKSKIQQNSLELAAAIKELEASTAALECSYSDSTQASQSSLNSSSGYGTMNSTPAVSEDTIASGDYFDTGQSEYGRQEQEKYFTIPRNSPMIKAAFQFKRPASTAGIPVSAQGGQLSRRSSLNTPKPPPPVRRSSSITSAPNSSVLQKYRNSPPRQLNTQSGANAQHPPQVSAKPVYQQNQSNHRRSRSASGSSNPEHAYAELTEIQQSIQARQQQEMNRQSQGGQFGYGPGALSAPVTPQYAQPVTTPNYPVGNSNVINSLNAKFVTMNSQPPQNSQSLTQHSTSSQSNCANITQQASAGAGDFPDLPPPPSEAELMEMEKVYSVPNQNIQQTQAYNVQTSQNVQMRTQTQAVNPVAGIDMRQSLISEMKAGNKFRKMSASDSDSQC
ncbi:protein MTSS 2-like isoform X2 [Mercenaria mercenaria]|uniref:protein MTSS 2-like isoform X2 n=1 Tax=Mercenaria mercenaria TaxID=6596 RepID=UPI00234EA5FE|nr:protein MTSS 2-like isoform X2 [Mercenaria mercenaria]